LLIIKIQPKSTSCSLVNGTTEILYMSQSENIKTLLIE